MIMPPNNISSDSVGLSGGSFLDRGLLNSRESPWCG
jgi:hypothetical protein